MPLLLYVPKTIKLTGIPISSTNVEFLIKGIDPNVGNSYLVDLSTTPKAITKAGNPLVVFDVNNNKGIRLNGSDTYLTAASSNDFNLGSTYTIDLELTLASHAPASRYCRVLTFGINDTSYSLALNLDSVGNVFFGIPKNGLTNAGIDSNFKLMLNTKHRITIGKSLGTVRIYIDGNLIKSSPMIDQSAGAMALCIGRDPATYSLINAVFNGWIHKVRVVKGEDLYQGQETINDQIGLTTNTSFYTKFDLLGFTDVTKKTSVWGTTNCVGSDVTLANSENSISLLNNSYAMFPYRAALNLNAATWTLELRFRSPTAFGSNTRTLIAHDTYGSNHDLSLSICNGNYFRVYSNGTTTVFDTPTFPTLEADKSYHVALVKASGVLKIYLDGKLVGSKAMSLSNSTQAQFTIGCRSWNNPNTFANCYISDIRFTREEVYKSEFTVPYKTEY